MADPKNDPKADKDDELVQVVAIERGHCGDRVREEGEPFYVPRKRLKDGSTWFVEPAKAEPKADDKPKSARPPGAGPLPK